MFQNPFRKPIEFTNQVLVLAKPDAVHNGGVGAILRMFENRSFWVRDCSERQMSVPLCSQHYRDHVDKPFYKSLVDFMTSGLTIAFRMQYVGDDDMIKVARDRVDRIRRLYACKNPRNFVHASDSLLSAQRELTLWFPKSQN